MCLHRAHGKERETENERHPTHAHRHALGSGHAKLLPTRERDDEGDDTGYVEDIYHEDVRTDSMAYGMLVTVQLDQREVLRG